MPAPIVVEVYAPAPRPQELAALIMACTRAAAPKECVSSDAKSAEPPLGVAIVRRDGDRARIELGLRSAPSAAWSTRDLVFQAGDDELERYRAIGFAIGTLVAGQAAQDSPPPIAEPKPPEPPPTKPTPPSTTVAPPSSIEAPPSEPDAEPEPPPERRTHRSAWIDAGGNLGLGLIPGPPRAGGSLRAALELLPHGLFAVVEGGYAERVGEPSLGAHWFHAAIGLGHPLAPRLRSVGVDVRLGVAFEHLSVTAVEGESSASDARFRPGVVAALDGQWKVTPGFGILVGASTFVGTKRTVVRAVGQDVGETPALGLSGFVGVRLRLR